MKKDSRKREYLTVGKKWLEELLGHCLVKAGENRWVHKNVLFVRC